MNRKTLDQIIRALKEGIITAKTYHNYNLCPTDECATCLNRRESEELLRKLEKQKESG